MEHLIFVFSLNLAAVVLMMILGWLLSLVLKNVTVVDSLWGLGFVIIAWTTFFFNGWFFNTKAVNRISGNVVGCKT